MTPPGVRAYLDSAAAAEPDPRVAEAMSRAVRELWASPSGLHAASAAAADALEDARARVAALIGADPEEIVFTSGPTEARNLAVAGLLSANRDLGRRAVITAVEHPGVVGALRRLERDGLEVHEVGVDAEGLVDPGAVGAAVDAGTALVSVHHGQHEVGTVQDVAALVAAARAARAEVRVHVDAAETAGLLPLRVDALGADAVTLGGPAMGAPAWTGALWVRPGAGLHPLLAGGAQEGGKRAGAHDLPSIVGLGVAAGLALVERDARAAHRRRLARVLAKGLLAVPEVRLNGPPLDRRLPGNVQVSVGRVEGESLALALAARGVAVSPGSACSADAGKASPTLLAMGLRAPWTLSAVLFSSGDRTTEAEVGIAVTAFAEAVEAMRAMSPIGR